jgi:nucleotide-binding universal stress UspA family protein
MEQGIMVPLDGTPFSEAALPVAILLARRDNIPLHLVTVWQPVHPSYLTSPHPDPWEGDKEVERRDYIERVCRVVRSTSNTQVSGHFLKGRPADVLPPFTETIRQDLVVMATHGHGALGRMWIGSVADEMARKSTTPVLLVRPEDEPNPAALEPRTLLHRVLVPLDGSELAERALDRAVIVGRGAAIELILLHIVSFPPPNVLAGIDIATAPDDHVISTERRAAEAYLNRVAGQMAPWGCSVRTVVLEAVSTRRAILAFAETDAIDLIAMASRGRGGAQRLLLGSVAASILRASSVPVLLFVPERGTRA